MSAITKSAKGETCTVRIPNVCNFNPETTVLAHKNGGGLSTKHNDIEACYACSDCHAWLDGGYVKTPPNAVNSAINASESRDLEHYRAAMETRGRLIEKGLIKLNGD